MPRTIWHWKAIGGFALCVLAAGLLSSVTAGLAAWFWPEKADGIALISVFVGMITGGVTSLLYIAFGPPLWDFD